MLAPAQAGDVVKAPGWQAGDGQGRVQSREGGTEEMPRAGRQVQGGNRAGKANKTLLVICLKFVWPLVIVDPII